MPMPVPMPMPVVIPQHQNPMVCTERFVDGVRQFYCVPEVGHASPALLFGILGFFILVSIGMIAYTKWG